MHSPLARVCDSYLFLSHLGYFSIYIRININRHLYRAIFYRLPHRLLTWITWIQSPLVFCLFAALLSSAQIFNEN